jgi:Txe/YoeB family toxin of Txe-Axe toxin-antitoxin module
MPKILPFNALVRQKIAKHNLQKKWSKQCELLSQNPQHPSLNLELLMPKEQGIYSFRLDRKYRALCIFRPDLQAIEILTITVHYR